MLGIFGFCKCSCQNGFPESFPKFLGMNRKNLAAKQFEECITRFWRISGGGPPPIVHRRRTEEGDGLAREARRHQELRVLLQELGARVLALLAEELDRTRSEVRSKRYEVRGKK